MNVVKLPKMTEMEMDSAIEKENICRIAFIDDDYPYISPFQYVYLNGTFYFHFTDYGKKKEILEEKKNNKVCIAIENFESNLSYYYFISIQGKLEEIKDTEEKIEVVEKMVNVAKEKYSTEFLSAHGFNKEKGWDHFLRDKNIKLYKLNEKGKRIGLKSIK
ncbi:MAG: pyridoxamine 5'-phosphate oxidase family protein [Promethearchaeota archaeon]|nr:MAG: pyridoxamine 5'-phosphate oxidase family protein [Candidatus Lokiarchaeota archaeon]